MIGKGLFSKMLPKCSDCGHGITDHRKYTGTSSSQFSSTDQLFRMCQWAKCMKCEEKHKEVECGLVQK